MTAKLTLTFHNLADNPKGISTDMEVDVSPGASKAEVMELYITKALYDLAHSPGFLTADQMSALLLRIDEFIKEDGVYAEEA